MEHLVCAGLVQLDPEQTGRSVDYDLQLIPNCNAAACSLDCLAALLSMGAERGGLRVPLEPFRLFCTAELLSFQLRHICVELRPAGFTI